MKKDTLIILGLIGIGLYLWYKKQKPIVADLTSKTPSDSTLNDSINLDFQFALNGVKKINKVPNTI